jgi:hypothetical protein
MRHRLGEVQSTDLGNLVGFGFNILNENGAPIVTFGYRDSTDAEKAWALVERAISNAVLIAAPRQ